MTLNPIRSLFNHVKTKLTGGNAPGPADTVFARKLLLNLEPTAMLTKGFEVSVPARSFIIDLLIEHNGQRIAVEYKDTESYDALRDEWHDALILGDGQVNTIYRFVGMDLEQFQDDCLFFISQSDPQLFSKRYKGRNSGLKFDPLERNVVFYNMVGDDEVVYKLKYILEHRKQSDRQGKWNILYDFAQKNPVIPFENLVGMDIPR